eukprot:COSAG02_NODE_1704_length_11240_cov_9.848308_12_plen_67_part_00
MLDQLAALAVPLVEAQSCNVGNRKPVKQETTTQNRLERVQARGTSVGGRATAYDLPTAYGSAKLDH